MAYVSFIPYFRLLVFGILVTLVAWFSFRFFPSCPSCPSILKIKWFFCIVVSSSPKGTKNQKWDERNINFLHFISAAVFVPPDPINHFAAIDRNSVLQVFSLQTKEEARFYSIRQCFAHFFSKKMPRAKNWRIKKNCLGMALQVYYGLSDFNCPP